VGRVSRSSRSARVSPSCDRPICPRSSSSVDCESGRNRARIWSRRRQATQMNQVRLRVGGGTAFPKVLTRQHDGRRPFPGRFHPFGGLIWARRSLSAPALDLPASISRSRNLQVAPRAMQSREVDDPRARFESLLVHTDSGRDLKVSATRSRNSDRARASVRLRSAPCLCGQRSPRSGRDRVGRP
jgi:hypothetical protein